jgi:glyoxylase-like metal-dependent hydrolase (beta-lactamase superfamily II)
VVVDTGAGAPDLLVGDAIYNSRVYANPDPASLPDGQAADIPTWQRSTAMLVELGAARVHYCHDPIVTRVRARPR